jgi:uncharacterized membrane protein
MLYMLGRLHVAFCLLSLCLGICILFSPKATRQHRWLGIAYCCSMLVLNLTALGIYNLTGHFNFFHFTALLSLSMVIIGWAQVRFRHRWRNWLYRHYTYMCWSYVALLAAAVNEGFVRLPPLKALIRRNGNWLIIVTQLLLLAAAALIINHHKLRLLARFSPAERV